MKSFEKYLENFWKKYLENFWKNILKIFEKIFWNFWKQYFENFGKNILKSRGIMFHLDCELKESENHHSSSFKKLGGGGGWWVHLDYNVSSAPFSELSWIWSFEQRRAGAELDNFLIKGSFPKKTTEDLVNSALKEGGYLTWITILNNNEIVKRGRGSGRKRYL